jgi:hypothetical protein
MKITESRLRSIIRNEMKSLMRESSIGSAESSPIGISAEDLALLAENTPNVVGYMRGNNFSAADGIDFMNLRTLDPTVRAVSIFGQRAHDLIDVYNRIVGLTAYVNGTPRVKMKYKEFFGNESLLAQIFLSAGAARRSVRDEELGERVWVPSAEHTQKMKDAIAALPVEEIRIFCADLRAADTGRRADNFGKFSR